MTQSIWTTWNGSCVITSLGFFLFIFSSFFILIEKNLTSSSIVHLQATLKGNTEVPGTTSFKPLLPSWSWPVGRFPCFVCKGARPSLHNSGWGRSHGEIRYVALWVVPLAESPEPLSLSPLSRPVVSPPSVPWPWLPACFLGPITPSPVSSSTHVASSPEPCPRAQQYRRGWENSMVGR